MLVNIMVFKLVLIKACFEPLSYNFFSKPHWIVNKKIKFSTSLRASDALTTRSTGKICPMFGFKGAKHRACYFFFLLKRSEWVPVR